MCASIISLRNFCFPLRLRGFFMMLLVHYNWFEKDLFLACDSSSMFKNINFFIGCGCGLDADSTCEKIQSGSWITNYDIPIMSWQEYTLHMLFIVKPTCVSLISSYLFKPHWLQCQNQGFESICMYIWLPKVRSLQLIWFRVPLGFLSFGPGIHQFGRETESKESAETIICRSRSCRRWVLGSWGGGGGGGSGGRGGCCGGCCCWCRWWDSWGSENGTGLCPNDTHTGPP